MTIIEQATLSDERLLEEELADGPDNDDDDMPQLWQYHRVEHRRSTCHTGFAPRHLRVHLG